MCVCTVRGVTQGGSSIPEVQRLLAALVASKGAGKIAEIGTAYGEGALAMVSALAPGATFLTVEPDAQRYAHACRVLDGTRAKIFNARWQDTLPQHGPFDLVFLDGGSPGDMVEAVGVLIDLLAPGGILVKDDLTPGIAVDADPLRAALLQDPRLAAVELLASGEMAVIIATRHH